MISQTIYFKLLGLKITLFYCSNEHEALATICISVLWINSELRELNQWDPRHKKILKFCSVLRTIRDSKTPINTRFTLENA